MIKIDRTRTDGWESAVRGMRNPLNSWAKSDSHYCWEPTTFTGGCWGCDLHSDPYCRVDKYIIGKADLDLMKRLVGSGTDHSKFMRMITVTADVLAPLYWWKEFDTYKVGTVANSCSTMHKIHEKEFTFDDFSYEHLHDEPNGWIMDEKGNNWCSALTLLETIIGTLNAYRYQYLATKDKRYWWQMIQLLPSSYNQKRTVLLNYAVLTNIYHARKNHKLDEWHDFCRWIENLPHSELITM